VKKKKFVKFENEKDNIEILSANYQRIALNIIYIIYIHSLAYFNDKESFQ
jgi:hypothetical protein